MTEYAHPEVLVDTAWVAEHSKDPNVRVVEVDVDTSYQFAVKQVLTMIVFQEQTGDYYASSKAFSPGDDGSHGTITKIDRIVR